MLQVIFYLQRKFPFCIFLTDLTIYYFLTKSFFRRSQKFSRLTSLSWTSVGVVIISISGVRMIKKTVSGVTRSMATKEIGSLFSDILENSSLHRFSIKLINEPKDPGQFFFPQFDSAIEDGQLWQKRSYPHQQRFFTAG